MPYNNLRSRWIMCAINFFLGGVDFKRRNGLNKKDLAPGNPIARNNDGVKRSITMPIKQRNKPFYRLRVT